MLGFLALVALALVSSPPAAAAARASALDEAGGACEPCDRSKCPAYNPDDCLVGVSLDACGCCYVCALNEGDACHQADGPKCGDNLECRERTDVGSAKESVCACKSQQEVCGSDGVTYATMCQLWAANARAGSKENKVMLQRQGRCPEKPRVRTPPSSLEAKEGDKITLSCEASGNPIPYISWTSRDADGAVVVLPSDDPRISVNIRGGPERYQVTGFLQIIGTAKQHESDYTCHAASDLGNDSATCRLLVKTGEKVA